MNTKEMDHWLSVASKKEQVRILKKVIKLLGNVQVSGCYGATADVNHKEIDVDKKTGVVWLHTDLCSG